MKFLLLMVCFLAASIHSFPNDFWMKDYSTIDSIARAIEPTTNLEKLSKRLTAHCNTDIDKYRSIFTWIAHHIAYDVEALKNKKPISTEARDIIKKQKAVCSGYSALFMQLCQLADLECVTINGWAKDKLTIGKPLSQTDHAWNAIRINNDWYLCDVTWGAGSTNEKTGAFNFDFKSFYFCTPPDLFSYNHFPENKEWLLEGEVSEQTFINRPHFYPTAIRVKLKELSLEDGIIKFKKDNVIEFGFVMNEIPGVITIHGSSEKYSKILKFSSKDGRIDFQYKMEKFSPYLTIFLDGKALLAYKVVQ